MQAITLLFLLFNALFIIHTATAVALPDPLSPDLTIHDPCSVGCAPGSTASPVRNVPQAPSILHLTDYRLVSISRYIPPPTPSEDLYLQVVYRSSSPLMPRTSSGSHTENIAKPKDQTTQIAGML